MKKQRNKYSSSGRKLIMVIEKDETVNSLISSCFDDSYEMIYAKTGTEALVYLKYLQKPHLILLNADTPETEINDFFKEGNVSTGINHHSVILILNAKYDQSRSCISACGDLKQIVNTLVAEELISHVNSVI